MLRRKLTESLTARVFLLTAAMLLLAGAITFGLIAWATPITYTAVVNDDLAQQVDALVQQLERVELADSGPLLDRFIRTSGADVLLLGPDGQAAETGSQLAVQSLSEGEVSCRVTVQDPPEGEQTAVSETDEVTVAEEGSMDSSFFTWSEGDSVAVTMSEQATVTAQVSFAGQPESCSLYVTPHLQAQNLAVRALVQMAPWLLLTLLVFSLLCAFGYSRYITRPIVRLSGIAGRMAQLDFHWECGERRRDELGQLGRSLDEMARRLSAALAELESANLALRREVEQRTAFFSAASHELKTPVTILKGQLSGMLEGVDIYKDRDKYLLRSLQVTGRMENLIREMLEISRMQGGSAALNCEQVDLAVLIERQLVLDAGLLEQRGQRLVTELTPGITVSADVSLLSKVVGNLAANASLYSPEGAEIRVWCGTLQGHPTLTVENSGAHIAQEALPHLFEAFYRAEGSRNRSTGGSGLGLYLVKVILEKHRASCTIENTPQGVRAGTVLKRLSSIKNTSLLQSGSIFAWYSTVIPTRKDCRIMEINIQNVSMTYPNGKQALRDFNLRLNSPSLVGLLGPNGAGKSTLMKLLVAALMPTSGCIAVDGAPLRKSERQLKEKLGYLPQDFGLFDELSVEQFLDYMAALKGLSGSRAAIREVIRAVNLEEKAKAKIRTLSGGQRQRVGIAQAMLGDPPFLILDEPTVGLDPEERIHFRNLFSRTAQERLVRLSTHIIEDVQSVCDRIVVIHHGQIRVLGTPEQLIQAAQGHVGIFWEQDAQDAVLEQGLHITARVNTSRGIRCRAVADVLPAYVKPEEPSLEDAYLYLIAGEAVQ